MFDILMFLFESYFYAGSYPDSDKLSLKLSAAGFEDEDIHRALEIEKRVQRIAGSVLGLVLGSNA